MPCQERQALPSDSFRCSLTRLRVPGHDVVHRVGQNISNACVDNARGDDRVPGRWSGMCHVDSIQGSQRVNSVGDTLKQRELIHLERILRERNHSCDGIPDRESRCACSSCIDGDAGLESKRSLGSGGSGRTRAPDIGKGSCQARRTLLKSSGTRSPRPSRGSDGPSWACLSGGTGLSGAACRTRGTRWTRGTRGTRGSCSFRSRGTRRHCSRLSGWTEHSQGPSSSRRPRPSMGPGNSHGSCHTCRPSRSREYRRRSCWTSFMKSCHARRSRIPCGSGRSRHTSNCRESCGSQHPRRSRHTGWTCCTRFRNSAVRSCRSCWSSFPDRTRCTCWVNRPRDT